MTDTTKPPAGGRVAHSMSEYRRLKYMGADVQPPAGDGCSLCQDDDPCGHAFPMKPPAGGEGLEPVCQECGRAICEHVALHLDLSVPQECETHPDAEMEWSCAECLSEQIEDGIRAASPAPRDTGVRGVLVAVEAAICRWRNEEPLSSVAKEEVHEVLTKVRAALNARPAPAAPATGPRCTWDGQAPQDGSHEYGCDRDAEIGFCREHYDRTIREAEQGAVQEYRQLHEAAPAEGEDEPCVKHYGVGWCRECGAGYDWARGVWIMPRRARGAK